MSSQSSFATATMQDMESGKSLLLTFGEPGRLLKRKIALTGFFCRILLFIFFNPLFLLRAHFFPAVWLRRRAFVVRTGRFVFPFRIKGHPFASSPHGQIIVINHPTLNDPICAILHALDAYPDREVIIPINLPWYESVCRYRTKLLKIGIKIIPVLTPETAKRLGVNVVQKEKPGGSESQCLPEVNILKNVTEVQTALVSHYTAELANTLSGGGLAVVAQQATRQRYLFTNKVQSETGENILPTVSLMLVGIRRAKLLEQTCIVPIGVIPYGFQAKSKLNPFRKYTLNVGEPILAADLFAVKNVAKRAADLHILQNLMELLPSEYHFSLK